MALPTRLNVGCGRTIRDDWCNLDLTWHDGMIEGRDVVAELGVDKLDLPENHFTEIEASHVVEHVGPILEAVEALWRVAAPDCKLTIRCPHGSSDDAHGDPTHVRPMFDQSFLYWGQGFYWRADYGYRGDWSLQQVTLITRDVDLEGVEEAGKLDAVYSELVRHGRNWVREMVAELVAVKPARPAVRESIDPLHLVLA